MKNLKIGQKVKITGAANVMSRFGIIKEDCFGFYMVKVACKYDRDRSLWFPVFTDDDKLVMLGADYLTPIA